MIRCVLELEADFEGVLVLYPYQAVLESIVVIVILEVSGVRSAPARRRVRSSESRLQESIARIAGGQASKSRLTRPLSVRGGVGDGNKEVVEAEVHLIDQRRTDGPTVFH